MKINRFISTAALAGALLTAPTPCVIAQVNPVSENSPAYGADSTSLSVVQSKPMQFRVFFNKPQSSKIVIRIVESTGEILFSETRAVASNYLRYFDLSPLHDGTYTFEIVDGQEKYTQSFDILTRTRRIVSASN